MKGTLLKILRKAGNLRRGESPFLQRPLGLQTRITLLFTVVVVSVLVVFSYLDFRLTEHSQRELWRERTIYVTREIDSKVFSPKDLENTAFLEEEIANWMYARPSIKSIDIFTFQKNTYKVMGSSWEGKDLEISYQSLDSLKRDLVLSTLKTQNGEPYWEILAPLHSGRKIIGGVRIRTSLEEVETFLANKRTRTIVFTLISVAVLILILTVFFIRAINRPIQRLVLAMSRAEEGKLQVAVPVQSRDELGLLTVHFNRMLSRISQFNEELTSRVEARNPGARRAERAAAPGQRVALPGPAPAGPVREALRPRPCGRDHGPRDRNAPELDLRLHSAHADGRNRFGVNDQAA